ncbi:MAG: CHAT domain-containing protein [Roseiflexaceae bacterium]|nr:CHAT domain-containing protein [Roseiflexaceae bacterium]
MNDRDIVIEASGAGRIQTDKTWQVRFKVRVVESPAGAMMPEQAIARAYEGRGMLGSIARLERRELDRDGLIAFGRTLATLLLPDQPGSVDVYDLFIRSLDLVGPDAGLRLRLRLPPLLAALPWEYLYVERAGAPDSIDGFLALDPCIAIVRDEVQPTPGTLAPLEGDIRVVAAFASPDDLPPLNVEREASDLTQTLANQPGITLDLLMDATRDELLQHIAGASVFHFAGHGEFRREPGDAPGTYTGTGALALHDQRIDAEQLAVNLGAGGVQLAVLGGCHTGRRDDISVWSGIAPTLVRSRAQIPAVVANQFSISDRSAIAFSKHFYRALVGGRSIEEAVAVGRIAIYNENKHGRDWGVPVLYLRQGDGRLFAGATDPAIRDQARADAEVIANLRVREVAQGGYVTGAEIGKMRSGKALVTAVIDTVRGTAIGARIGGMGGGEVKVDENVDVVGPGGALVGAQIGNLGSAPGAPQTPSGDQPAARVTTIQQTTGAVGPGGTVVGSVEGGGAPLTIGGVHHHGAKVEGDNIIVGDIKDSSGVAIGRGARAEVRTVNTGGGDYAKGNIDKRQGIFVDKSGSLSAGKVTISDQMNISNVSGSILNIRSSLSDASQTISASPHGDAATKAELQALIAQLSAALQQAPLEKAADAEAVAETAKAAIDQATKAQPNRTLVQINANGLKQAAQNLAAVLPAVLPVAEKIAELVMRMTR